MIIIVRECSGMNKRNMNGMFGGTYTQMLSAMHKQHILPNFDGCTHIYIYINTYKHTQIRNIYIKQMIVWENFWKLTFDSRRHEYSLYVGQVVNVIYYS